MSLLLRRATRALASLGIVGILVACTTPAPAPSEDASPVAGPPAASVLGQAQSPDAGQAGSAMPWQPGRSRWVAVGWSALPGFGDDALHEAWNAWLKSCERPGAAFAPLCPDIRVLSLASAREQRDWMMRRLQPYRVESQTGGPDGLLTAYYEPLLQASRTQRAGYGVPLYRPPPRLAARKPWYTRKEIETLPLAQAALRGQEIAWLADPIDALLLQIQGSGRVQVREPDGQTRLVRLAYAATNDQPYGSVGRWLLDQGQVQEASWPAIRNWAALHPQRVQEMLWSNPRTVFFREEPLSDLDAAFGPRGAQGVPLTPGRSIAVDPLSIPYGTPVWLASEGPTLRLQRLVLAQDTGSAIVGAVRADYFVGWGGQAGDIAGRLKQPLQLWVLWPRS